MFCAMTMSSESYVASHHCDSSPLKLQIRCQKHQYKTSMVLPRYSMFAMQSYGFVEGILPQKISYRQNLKFWIVMGCGEACFGWKGQKTTYN